MAYFRQLMYDASALQEHMMYFEKHIGYGSTRTK